MPKSTVLGACLASACALAWCRSGNAESKVQAHMGLETSLVDSTSTETTRRVPDTTAGANTTAKYVSNSTQYGLSGRQALSFGLLISDVLDIGTRLGYSNKTTKLGDDATASDVTLDEYAISPYVAYVSGNRDSRVRFTAGGLVGVGAANANATSPASNADGPVPSVKSSFSTTQYGVLLGLRLHLGELLSIDPIATITKTSAKMSGSGMVGDIETSGMSFLLNVGLSLWFGGGQREAPQSPEPTRANQPQPPAAPSTPAPPPTAMSVPALPAKSPAPASGVSAQTSGPPTTPTAVPIAPAVPGVAAAPEKPTRLLLSLGEGRTALLMVRQAGSTPSVSIVLQEARADNAFTNCKQIVLNAPYQPEVPLAAVLARGVTAGVPVPVLKAETSPEQLKVFAASPATDSDGSSDHWLDVCGSVWNLVEGERVRLKGYLDAL